MTVGFLYGAGAETLIFVTGTSGKNPKFFVSQQKNKVSCGYPENQEKLVFGYPVLRSKPQRWIPELRFGYPPLRSFPKSVLGKTRNSSRKFRGVSAPALYKNPAVIQQSRGKVFCSEIRIVLCLKACRSLKNGGH